MHLWGRLSTCRPIVNRPLLQPLTITASRFAGCRNAGQARTGKSNAASPQGAYEMVTVGRPARSTPDRWAEGPRFDSPHAFKFAGGIQRGNGPVDGPAVGCLIGRGVGGKQERKAQNCFHACIMPHDSHPFNLQTTRNRNNTSRTCVPTSSMRFKSRGPTPNSSASCSVLSHFSKGGAPRTAIGS